MDPIGGIASIITLAALSQDIVQTCRKYVKNYREAPIIFTRFCDELETLSILFERFLALQYATQHDPSYRSGALEEVLRRAHLLKDYENQLRKLKARISKVEINSIGRRLLFPIHEKRILEGFDIVQRIRSNLESALRLDDSFYIHTMRNEVQKINIALQISNQMFIHSSRKKAKLQEPTPNSDVARILQVRESHRLYEHSTATHKRTTTKKILNLSSGRLSIHNESSSAISELHQATHKVKRSRVAIFFVPTLAFWQTIIHLRFEWAWRLDSLMMPMLSLQFFDIIQDDHPIIRASIQGDMSILENLLSSQKISPFCSTTAGWTPLHFAAAYGQINACKLLMTQGAPLDATGCRGITPLHVASHFGHFEVFKALMEAGVDPDDCHEHGLNAMFEILSNEKVSDPSKLAEFVKWVLYGQQRFALDVHARDNSNRTILYHLSYPANSANSASLTVTASQSEAIEFVLREGVAGDELDIHGMSVLHTACRDNRLDLVQELLSGHCSVNAEDARGYTPLHYAVETQNFEIVSLLLQHGCDINAAAHDDDYRDRPWTGHPTPLYLAAKLDRLDMVEFLIQHGAGRCDNDVSDAFHVAVAEKSIETVQYFIENHTHQLNFSECIHEAKDNSTLVEILCKAGAPVDEDLDSERTPLGWAAYCGCSHATKTLIDHGADMNKLMRGLTPLGLAAESGYDHIVDLLLAAGAQPDLTGDNMPTPWSLATSHGYDEIAGNIARHSNTNTSRKVVEDFSMNRPDQESDLPEVSLEAEWDLTSAAVNGELEVANKLIEKGCTLKAGKSSIWSPLYLAISWEKWTVAERLVQAGAEMNLCEKNVHGDVDMPFMEAILHENVPFIQFMIKQGADVTIRDEDHSTPLLQCLDLFWSRRKACRSNGEIVRVLLGAGAKANVVDKFGRTPLGKAAAVGNFEAVMALVEAGADLDRPSSQNSAEPINWAEELVYRTPLAWAALNGHKQVVKYLFDSGAEWRSLRAEPAVWYTHRLLMQSWFPDHERAPVDSEPGFDLLTVPSIDTFNDTQIQVSKHDGSKTAPMVVIRREDANFNLCKSSKLCTFAVSVTQTLIPWVQKLQHRLQLVRIETVVFTGVSFLLLAHKSLRYLHIPSWAHVRFAVLALLIGMLLASWMQQSAI